MTHFTGIFKKEPIAEYYSATDGLDVRENIAVYKNCIIATDGDKTLYFWGSLYNQIDLEDIFGKQENIAALVLKIINEKECEGLKLLNGEFSLIIIEKGGVFAFRDRHGAGPQFYFSNSCFFSFLTDYKNFKDSKVRANIETIKTFLQIGYIPSPKTSIEGVRKLPGGYCLHFKDDKIEVKDLYPYDEFLETDPTFALSAEEATKEYERLHKLAIQVRIKDKSNVGLLLSGGYDSGGNISALRDIYNGKVTTFSIGFKDNPWTELPLAKILADKFNAEHHEYEIDGSEIEDLPQILKYVGDPFQENGLMVNYSVMKLIGGNKPDVILGGDGNDQHFGTAGKELALNYLSGKNGIKMLQKMLSSVSSMSAFNKDNKFFRIKFHNDKVLNILKSDKFGFQDYQLKKLINGNGLKPEEYYLNGLPKRFKTFDDLYLAHNYFGDIKQVINEVILFKASKMSSLFANNLSFPYMDTEIYNFLKKLPREYKFNGSVKEAAKGHGVTKFLHKNYLKPKLPSEITDRKKQGGFAPLPIFFKDDVRRNELANYVLDSRAAKELFNINYLKQFFNEYNALASSKGYWFWYKQVKACQFFNLVTVALWWDIFIENKEGSVIKDFY
jgi:asparagine synthase (glutamine-hydrolysing)